jgi:hypothetical protein
MAEDKVETREIHWRHLLPWTELFRGFRVAIGFSKLVLAAAGILVMCLGWYALSALAYNLYGEKPDLSQAIYSSSEQKSGENEAEREILAWKVFRLHREQWNLMHRTAGPANSDEKFEASDLAESLQEYKEIKADLKDAAAQIPDERVRAMLDHMAREHLVSLPEISRVHQETKISEVRLKAWVVNRDIPKRAGTMRTLPWYEDRGPNPFLLATGQAGIPWETGHFWDWLLTKQVPVLVEPLIKFFQPIIYFFSPRAFWFSRMYFVLVLLWTLATWGLFGGALTRMSAVEVARNEKVGPLDSLRFVWKRYVHFLCAPLVPLVIVVGLTLILVLYGFFHWCPWLGDVVVDGLGWWITLVVGLFMALMLIGLVTWPLMLATVSAEDEEFLNAFARAYTYLVQAPWHYLWYSVVGLAYGAVLVFFVGFVGSLAVYLASWGVNSNPVLPATGRETNRLFVYAPTSFGWRELLLQGASVDNGNQPIVQDGRINESAYAKYIKENGWNNTIGAFLVAIWLGIFFLFVIGFGYSYFWTASTIIYLLMRRRVDDAELDEVYFEEDDQEDYPLSPAPATKTAPPPPPAPGMTMVEPPALRISTPAAPPPTPAPAAAAAPSEPGTAKPPLEKESSASPDKEKPA